MSEGLYTEFDKCLPKGSEHIRPCKSLLRALSTVLLKTNCTK